MDRDYQTKGEILLNTRFGTVSADNFTLSPDDMTTDQAFQKAAGIEGGPFCLVPAELDIPF